MASNFIPPVDILNNIQPKKNRKTFSDDSDRSILDEAKKMVSESFETDMFAQVGSLNAIVLEVIEGESSAMAWKHTITSFAFGVKKTMPDFIEVRYRVPELHAHLPEPADAKDYKNINLHPVAIMKKDKGIPSVGDIIKLDFEDKNNFRGASVLESFNTPEGANPGGNCAPADTFNSSAPALNVASPTGDTLTTSKDQYSAKNEPANEAFLDGIEYPAPAEMIEYKKNIYGVSVPEFETMVDFLNADSVINTLASKNVFSVCFTVSESGKLIRDVNRLIKIIKRCNLANIDVSLKITEDTSNINKAMLHLSSICRKGIIKSLIFELAGDFEEQSMSRSDKAMRNLADSIGCEYGVIIKEDNLTSKFPTLQDYTYLAANTRDYNYERMSYRFVADDPGSLTAKGALLLKFPDAMNMLYLGGINFVKLPSDPCISGARTKEILDTNLRRSALSGGERYFFKNYSFLTSELISSIEQNRGTAELNSNKQNLLTSLNPIKKANRNDAQNISGTSPSQTIEAPTFNSSGGSQSAQTAPAASFDSAPGSQCTPIAGGSEPAANTSAGGSPSAPVEAPSFRFDSIDNYTGLGWTADNSAAINNVIYEFLQNFSAAMYRRIPATDPIFANSVYKKIRVTSTARTYEKQAYLMWDKIRQGGDSAVYGLYGNKDWTRKVVEAYHAGGNPQSAESIYSNPKFADAVAAVKYRVEVEGGGSAHLQGKGVDIHTWSHLQAEGVSNAQSANINQMNNSRYVKAIIAACQEVGAKPTVEAYQQHVHITIL